MSPVKLAVELPDCGHGKPRCPYEHLVGIQPCGWEANGNKFDRELSLMSGL